MTQAATLTKLDETRHSCGDAGEAPIAAREDHAPEDPVRHALAAWDARLTQVQALAVHALVAGATVTQAALVAGVTRQSVSFWRNRDEDFRYALKAASYEFHREMMDRLRALCGAALDVLAGVLDDPKADPAMRLRAALFLAARIPALRPAKPLSRFFETSDVL